MAWYDSIIGKENADAARAAYANSSFKQTVDTVSDAASTAQDYVVETAGDVKEAGLGLVDDIQEYKDSNAAKAEAGTAWYNDPKDTPLPEGYSGNIDLNARKVYKPEGENYIQTEESFGYGVDPDTEVIIARIVDGKRVSKKEAIDHFLSSGEHLGIYERGEGESDKDFYGRTDAEANKIHERQAKFYRDELPAEGTVNPSAGDQEFARVMEPNGMEEQSAILLAGFGGGATKVAPAITGATKAGLSPSTARAITAYQVEVAKQQTAGAAKKFAEDKAKQAGLRVARPTGPIQSTPQQDIIRSEFGSNASRNAS